MAGYLRLELLRTIRDPKYIILAVLSPIGFYLLFSTLFGGQSTSSAGMTVQAALMVSMGLYGAMWAVMSATGPRIAQDRTTGWARQMRLLPIRTANTLAARLIAAVLLAGPAIVLVMLTAVFAKGVTLDDAWRWAVLLALLWLGSIPIALLGMAIGYGIGPEVAESVHHFFSNPRNRKVIDRLLKAGVQPVAETRPEGPRELDGEIVVFTGGLETMPRPDAQRLAERHGARVAGSLSKKVTLVVAGPGAGSKLDDARRLGVKVIDERTFLERIGQA